MANSARAFNAGNGVFEVDFTSDAFAPDGSGGYGGTVIRVNGADHTVTGSLGSEGVTYSGTYAASLSGQVSWLVSRIYRTSTIPGESGTVNMSPSNNYVPAVML